MPIVRKWLRTNIKWNELFAKIMQCGTYKRHLLTFMVFIGYLIFFGLHANVSLITVEMTSAKNITLKNGTIQEIPAEFQWNPQQRALVLSSFAYGRLFAPIGGVLAGKIGGSRMYAIGILGTALINALSPFCLHLHLYLFIFAMALTGTFESFAYAAVPQIWSRWVPPEERARSLSLCIIGMYGGPLLSFIIAGWILATWNWAVLFYYSGALTFVWFILWVLIVRDDPSEDKHISPVELKYIQQKLHHVGHKEKVSYPWKDLLTSMPFWTIGLCKFCAGLGFTLAVYHLPQYIKDVNNMDIEKIGYFSALPQLSSVIAMPITGYLFDFIRVRGLLSPTNAHKLYNSLGLFCGAAAFVAAALWPNFVVCLVCIAWFQFFISFTVTSIQVSFLDLAPRYSSFMSGVSTTLYTSACIITPNLVAYYVTDHKVEQWNICFIALSVVFALIGSLYLKFGSGDLQPWANYKLDQSDYDESQTKLSKI